MGAWVAWGVLLLEGVVVLGLAGGLVGWWQTRRGVPAAWLVDAPGRRLDNGGPR